MKICMISLGCDKNLVDSEMMLGYLRRDDVALTDEQAEADVIIVNTCAFILDAKDESIQTMLTAARYKEEGQLKALIMTGCMAERYKNEVLREIPEIDAVVGTSAYDKISAGARPGGREGHGIRRFKPSARHRHRDKACPDFSGCLRLSENRRRL